MYCTFSCFNKQANYIRLYVLRPAQAVNFMFYRRPNLQNLQFSASSQSILLLQSRNCRIWEKRGERHILLISCFTDNFYCCCGTKFAMRLSQQFYNKKKFTNFSGQFYFGMADSFHSYHPVLYIILSRSHFVIPLIQGLIFLFYC